MNLLPSPDVSVVIPTYNRLPWLQEALDSVWRQSCPALEVIVVDDGSTDGTSDWLESLEGKLAIVLRQERAGPAAARNFGAARAAGKYLAFLDSDDFWLPEKLRVQRSFMEGHPEFQVCQTEEIWIRNGVRVNPRRKHEKPSGWVFERCLPLCVISPSGVMLRREFFLGLGGFDPAFPVCEDYELWLRASLRSPVQTLPQPLVVKRGGHPDQLSRALPAIDQYRALAMVKTLEREMLTEGQRLALLHELRCKLRVLSKGFQKRYPQERNLHQERLLWLEKNHPLA